MNATPVIPPAALAEACRQSPAPLLLDVRTPPEVREIGIAGAMSVPLDELKPDAFAKEHGTSRCVVICRGGTRARKAADMLMASGMRDVSVLDGGMLAWETAGLPVLRGKKFISLDRQVRIAIGTLVLMGWVLGTWVHPAWFGICGFMGAGLIFSGIADFCGLARILAKAPWNKAGGDCACAVVK
jgi:rhodanese-related sulfurtransferase